MVKNFSQKKSKFYSRRNFEDLSQIRFLSSEQKHAIRVVSTVFPFRVNSYVTEELINWNDLDNDPIFKMFFNQRQMLSEEDFSAISDALDGTPEALAETVAMVRLKMNPHPAGQATCNVPFYAGQRVPGVQHKYPETCLVFPSQGQSCFSYCTFCFRWPQFVKPRMHHFATDQSDLHLRYIRSHRELTDVVFTGGDPMVMSAARLRAHIEPLLNPEFDHIRNIRIGTKSLGHWPYRYLTDSDSEEILDLFHKINRKGKHLSIMAHFTHFNELSTLAVKRATEKILDTGATIRTQSPLLRGINDQAGIWSRMWREQVAMGMVPYYMFIERETGPKDYFEVPLYEAWKVFQSAISQISGLGRTVRGPSMSALAGKINVDGITEVNGKRAFVLSFLQGRNPEWCGKPFLAKFNPKATWVDQLKPLEGEEFFYEKDLKRILRADYWKDKAAIDNAFEKNL